jgi:hypothetical protein
VTSSSSSTSSSTTSSSTSSTVPMVPNTCYTCAGNIPQTLSLTLSIVGYGLPWFFPTNDPAGTYVLNWNPTFTRWESVCTPCPSGCYGKAFFGCSGGLQVLAFNSSACNLGVGGCTVSYTIATGNSFHCDPFLWDVTTTQNLHLTVHAVITE